MTISDWRRTPWSGAVNPVNKQDEGKTVPDEGAPGDPQTVTGPQKEGVGTGTAPSPSGEQKEKRRRRRDPFRGDAPISSSEAAISSRQLTTLSELKRIKRARVRHEGQRVVTDDVKKLKSLSIEPHLQAGEFINFYVEAVRIEYYIPRESRFSVETKYLYIPLFNPEVREQDTILREYMKQNRFFDLIDVMNEYPQHITEILESYNNTMKMYENLSGMIKEAKWDENLYRRAFYLCEILGDYEPSLAALEFLGQFQAWNLNWLVRKMNSLGVEFTAADKTVSYFIKLRNIHWEKMGYDYDERFEILAALFYEQAFPNRTLPGDKGDYIYGAFD